MKIIVMGNVGSGKTTLISSMLEHYQWDVVSIDDYRRSFGNGTRETELLARQNFAAGVISTCNQFVECTGFGEVSDSLFKKLQASNEPLVCLILDVPLKICRDRLALRKWDVPFTAPLDGLSRFMEKVDAKIQSGESENEWKSKKSAIVLRRRNIVSYDKEEIVGELASIIDKIEAETKHVA